MPLSVGKTNFVDESEDFIYNTTPPPKARGVFAEVGPKGCKSRRDREIAPPGNVREATTTSHHMTAKHDLHKDAINRHTNMDGGKLMGPQP